MGISDMGKRKSKMNITNFNDSFRTRNEEREPQDQAHPYSSLLFFSP